MRLTKLSPMTPLIGAEKFISGVFQRWLARLVEAVQEKLVSVGVQTADYTAAAWEMVPCNTTAGGITVTLPTQPPGGTEVAVKVVAGANPITFTAGGDDTIEGGASAAITDWCLAVYDHTEENWVALT